ncbi:DUF853 family protein [Peptoniphilus equinus]|uniref:DUF853 family protein n=1 Tax=Peptoniphilus equinus TaxID=3016343 RepID=A0ABY7QVZ5_9FIRM|nr:helicase HerA-like domain-containing protein [Peptoniphilus equinus]WBW50215.1 DUF853 family protein [Peptoniphilus equinus]
MEALFFGKGHEPATIALNQLNKHALIAGATGTGKTVSLKVLAEQLSAQGVPVILSDVKGDLSGLTRPGTTNPDIDERLKTVGTSDFVFQGYPTRFWDTAGLKGLHLKVTVSDMGPLLLGQILELNESQLAHLITVFNIADDAGLLLLDFKDLKAMLQFVITHRKDLEANYGALTTASLNAIDRRLIVVEHDGADAFFGEPPVDIGHFFETREGLGTINIIQSQTLIAHPTLYSMFMLYMLSELFEQLPEVGNPDKPKLVFFFDEAHLLFDNAPKALLQKIEQVVRLIRSKGVGIVFVTQNPLDVPDAVSSQLATRIIHNLRAYSPKEQKAVRAVAKTFRPRDGLNTEDALSRLGTGVALFSTLDSDGAPSPVDVVTVAPPHSSFEPLTDTALEQTVKNDPLFHHYAESVDRESAYEYLKARAQRTSNSAKKTPQRGGASILDSVASSFTRSIARSIGSSLARGLMGSLRKR